MSEGHEGHKEIEREHATAWSSDTGVGGSIPQADGDAGSKAPITPYPCLVCGRELEAVCPPSRQPNDGVMCMAVGNYGSREHDNLFRKVRWFNVCDPCFREGLPRMSNLEPHLETVRKERR